MKESKENSVSFYSLSEEKSALESSESTSYKQLEIAQNWTGSIKNSTKRCGFVTTSHLFHNVHIVSRFLKATIPTGASLVRLNLISPCSQDIQRYKQTYVQGELSARRSIWSESRLVLECYKYREHSKLGCDHYVKSHSKRRTTSKYYYSKLVN